MSFYAHWEPGYARCASNASVPSVLNTPDRPTISIDTIKI